MFRAGPAPDPLESIALEDTDSGATVKVAPTRGGLVTRFAVGDTDVLFMDDASLQDAAKNVRGGIPVLFPSPGRLEGDAWTQSGHTGKLLQHGFARNLAWETVGTSESGSAACTLRLGYGNATRELWPWNFMLEHRVSLRGSTLRIDQRVENRSDTAMPFGLGFHPYFRVPQADKGQARIETRARRAFDNVSKRYVEVHGIDLRQREVDLHLQDHDSSENALSLPGGTVHIRCSDSYRRWVVWTLEGRDFVCLEPWTSPGNALNTGEGLIRLAPGGARESHIEITWAAA